MSQFPISRGSFSYEKTSTLSDHHQLVLRGSGRSRDCLPPVGVQGTTSLSIGRRVGVPRSSDGDSLWSLYAPGPQLGALAFGGLARLSRHPQRLSFSTGVGNARRPARHICIFSVPPGSHAVFSPCKIRGAVNAGLPGTPFLLNLPIGTRAPQSFLAGS